MYWYVCVCYKSFCIVIFLYVIQSNCCLYFILVFISISLLCMCYSATESLLHLCLYYYVCEFYIYGYFDMFLYFIRSAPWLHYILEILSCIFLAVIFVDLHSQKWINISLFELVVTCIEILIFLPCFSISHIFISIIKNFCYLSLLLGHIFTSDIIHPKTCIQYAIYDRVHPKTPPFSARHLIWVNYKVVSQFSQPILLSFSYLNSVRHSLVINFSFC